MIPLTDIQQETVRRYLGSSIIENMPDLEILVFCPWKLTPVRVLELIKQVMAVGELKELGTILAQQCHELKSQLEQLNQRPMIQAHCPECGKDWQYEGHNTLIVE